MKMTGGSCIRENIESHLQVCTLLAASTGYENRVQEIKPDPQHMGYFSYMEMEGKGEAKLLIISCYRPCKGSTKGGEGTIWKQQWARAQHLGLGEDYDPRKEMLISLVNLLSKYPDHELIIGGDFNGVDECDSLEEGSIAWFTAESGVIDIHDAFHTGPFPSTYDRGTKRIDQIYVSDRLSSEILSIHRPSGDTTQFSLAIIARFS